MKKAHNKKIILIIFATLLLILAVIYYQLFTDSDKKVGIGNALKTPLDINVVKISEILKYLGESCTMYQK
jgi:hypothetical protein